jgi:hypothetical protein
VSCFELYHEHVYDLFGETPTSGIKPALHVREHATEGFFLEGCKNINCTSYALACDAVGFAMRNRQIGGHEMNARSSRSHCITDIFIDIPKQAISKDSKELVEFSMNGKMTLVDLAGSERLKSTHSEGKVLHEAGFINRSLYVLGKVIAGIVRTGGDLNHKDVPYRDSKLTKLLINSLGGQTRSLIVACCTEASGSHIETLRTLKFRWDFSNINKKHVFATLFTIFYECDVIASLIHL